MQTIMERASQILSYVTEHGGTTDCNGKADKMASMLFGAGVEPTNIKASKGKGNPSGVSLFRMTDEWVWMPHCDKKEFLRQLHIILTEESQ